MPDILILVVVVVALGFFVFLMILLRYGWIWIQALASGVHISFMRLIGMSLRRISPAVIVNSMIMASKAGLKIEWDPLEANYMARGNVPNVIRSLIA